MMNTSQIAYGGIIVANTDFAFGGDSNSYIWTYSDDFGGSDIYDLDGSAAYITSSGFRLPMLIGGTGTQSFVWVAVK